MSQHLLKSPDSVSATATPQAVTLPETQCWYSIRNSGSGSVYYFSIDISDYTAATYTSATAAALRTAGCSMVAAGETVAFYTDMPQIYLVCANTVTATVNIEAGILGPTVNNEINIGNVGLLDSAEAEINPAKEDGNLASILTAVQLIDDAGHGSATASTQRNVLSVDVDLDKETQSKAHTHTTAGTAESIAGDAAFSAGATVMIVGIDTWVAVGSSAAQAQGGDVKFPAGVPFTVQLDGTEVTFHLDAATGGSVSIHQVS